ncbi:SDR family oxidoreductase [Amycolatopsis sp. PS_44_ISF1]|uniref:SDR family oxidoreductase n=1 Tax=Amycolatopsis sp. PS_44_ISF1 TaxID=2974917 RepID=UPI0028DD65AE|nr:SDR family oxidoreductase [Amycolatopsis sp. PS_44_ISF1]MDT8915977.1 SDR family oxidoreductase [Amycolatopsis sp. PS_44_ISF1]
MQVFLTGATGFVGSSVVAELLDAGHEVAGLSRSDAGAEALARAGAKVCRGDVNDLEKLRAAVASADGVIHTAFDHDLAEQKRHSENDRKVITTLGEALTGTGRPLVITSGTGLVRSATGEPVRETDGHATSAVFARAASEEAAEALIERGANVVVVRLPQVHDPRRAGRLRWHIQIAREQGRVAYVGEGRNRVPAVHVSDAVRLFRLALERGRAGARYHAVAEEGVPLREIAETIGAGLRLPVESITPEEAPGYFGRLAQLAALDLPASGAQTRRELGWTPTGPGLLADLREADYDVVRAVGPERG